MTSKKCVKRVIATVVLTGTLLMSGPSTYAALGDQLLSRGMQHQDVATLQEHLKDLGHFNFPSITNFYGTVTEQAVRDFQRQQGLVVDGLFGQASFRALQASINTPTRSNPNRTDSSAFAYSRVLRLGTSGQDVKSLQDVLKSLGYLNIANTTTYYGTMTRDAVMNFQRANGLVADGIFGNMSSTTLNNILGGSTPAPAPSNPTVGGTLNYSRLLRMGVSGNDVKALQDALKSLGHLVIANTTNYYGAMTRDAVMSFQRSQGILVDGIAGQATINAINSALSGQTGEPSRSSQPRNTSRDQLTSRLIAEARKYLSPRSPYVFGGSTPAGFDCSGYTQYVYRQVGVTIPRDTIGQSRAGTKVSKQDLQPGDLVMFYGTYRPGPSHVGIYLGDNLFIHSRSGGNYGVSIDNLTSNYYSTHFQYGRSVY